MTYLIADQICVHYPIQSLKQTDSAGSASVRQNRNVVQAIDNLTLTLESGDRVAILGRNGAGKTTLLRTLAGILIPTSGSVKVHGRCTNLINLNIGIEDQASGHDNITIRGLLAGHSQKQIDEERNNIVEFANLGDFINLPVNTYSSGMRMRLSFAIATAFYPQILILDEWISTGDGTFREKASERMKSFVDKAGILVLASHNRALLKQNCNKALWLERGSTVRFGPLVDVLSAYDEFMKKSPDAAGGRII